MHMIQEGLKVLEHKDQRKEMAKHMESSLKDLKLDDRKTMGYTFKALGAGFYSLRKGANFKKTITEVIMEAGDADRSVGSFLFSLFLKQVVLFHMYSNAAVCGALMGCRFGFKALPEDLLNFPHREWLDKKVELFLKTIGLA